MGASACSSSAPRASRPRRCCAGWRRTSSRCRLPPVAGRFRRSARAAVAISLLDSYTAEERGSRWRSGDRRDARADHGPTLGAWLTDNYSWHWSSSSPPDRHPDCARTDDLHAGNRDAERQAFRLVRLLRARGWYRLTAADARSRRAARLVRLQRDHRRAIVSAAGFLLLPDALAYDHVHLRAAGAVPRSQFVAGSLFMVVIGVVLFGTWRW